MSTEMSEFEQDDHQARPVAGSIINSETSIEGTIKSSTDLRVDGLVNGAIECDGVLYVSEGAIVDATIEAGGIVVEGSLNGTIMCHGRLEIRATGHVNAEVETERLMIHEGAVYEGRLRMDAPARPEVQDPAEIEAANDSLPAIERATPEPYPYLRSFSASASQDAGDGGDVPGTEGDSNRK